MYSKCTLYKHRAKTTAFGAFQSTCTLWLRLLYYSLKIVNKQKHGAECLDQFDNECGMKS